MASLALVHSSEVDSGSDVAGETNLFNANHRAALLAIIRERSFKTGLFTLSSGKQSTQYFNMKPTMMDVNGAGLSARAFIDLMQKSDAEYVSGLEMGAVPVIGAMAALGSAIGHPVKTTFVRKRQKEHGTKELIEGLGPNESLTDKIVFVVDDVATSGKSILQAIEEVRRAGGIVTDAAALVNRNEGGDELLASHGVKLHHVFCATEVASSN